MEALTTELSRAETRPKNLEMAVLSPDISAMIATATVAHHL